MDKEEAKIRILLKLALKYRVKQEGKKFTCLLCGWSTEPNEAEAKELGYLYIPSFMELHIRDHIIAGDITEQNIMEGGDKASLSE